MTHPKPYAVAPEYLPLIERRMTYNEFAAAFGYNGLTKCTKDQFNYRSRKGFCVPVSLQQAEMDYWPQRIAQILKAVEDAHHAS